MKRADQSGASLALILGEDELRTGSMVIKPLRSDADQRTVAVGDVPAALRAVFTELG